MGTRRGSLYTDEETLRMWMNRGAVHVPLLTLAWPGAMPKVLPEPISIDRLRWHLHMDHCIWHMSSRSLVRLGKMHSERHEDPLWSHVLHPGEFVHVHDAVMKEEGEWNQWEW